MRGRVAIALLGWVVAACGLGEGGTGLAHQRDGEDYPGDRRELTGVVNGGPACWHIALDEGSYFVIWPPSTADEPVGDEWGAKLPQGDVIAAGDTVTGTGAFTQTEPLAVGNAYWDHVFGLCDVAAAEVVVFDVARLGP